MRRNMISMQWSIFREIPMWNVYVKYANLYYPFVTKVYEKINESKTLISRKCFALPLSYVIHFNWFFSEMFNWREIARNVFNSTENKTLLKNLRRDNFSATLSCSNVYEWWHKNNEDWIEKKSYLQTILKLVLKGYVIFQNDEFENIDILTIWVLCMALALM